MFDELRNRERPAERVWGLDPRKAAGRNPADRLRKLYIIALGTIAVLTIASQVVIQFALVRQESDAPVINIAGRQRMLSQKLAKSALAINEVLDHYDVDDGSPVVRSAQLQAHVDELRGALDLWVRSHLGLRHGDPGLDLPGVNSPEVTVLFEKIESPYRTMGDAAEKLLACVEDAGPDGPDAIAARQHTITIGDHEDPFVIGMNAIVFQHEAEARDRVAQLKRTGLTLMSIILLVLLAEALLILGPAAGVIRRQFTRLREGEEWLSTVLTSIDDAVIATDTEGLVRLMNPVAQVVTGWRQIDAAGKPLTDVFALVDQQTGKPEPSPIASVLSEGVAVGTASHPALTSKDGTRRDVEYNATPLKDAEGRVIGGVLVFRDITDRRRADQAVREARERLLEHQRTAKERVQIELERVRGELVSKTRLAAIGQVSASIGHELRNPLGAVRNAVYLLKRRAPEGETAWSKYLGIIDEEVNRANRTIGNLMEMSRPKAPNKQETDLGLIVREARERANLPSDVGWRLTLEPDPFPIRVDPTQLGQVLSNLVSNAVEAMNGHGHIAVDARRAGAYDGIVVRDDGPGVPPEDRQHLFEPLFSTKVKGTGLGLTICRQIIERHGGTINLLEEDGKGAALEIRLPRTRSD